MVSVPWAAAPGASIAQGARTKSTVSKNLAIILPPRSGPGPPIIRSRHRKDSRARPFAPSRVALETRPEDQGERRREVERAGERTFVLGLGTARYRRPCGRRPG